MQKENKPTVGQLVRLVVLQQSKQMEWQHRGRVPKPDLPAHYPLHWKPCDDRADGTGGQNFYAELKGQGLSGKSIWCVYLLLRRCMDEAAWEQRMKSLPGTRKKEKKQTF